MVHTGGESLQDGLRDMWTCRTTLALAYVLYYLFATVTISDERKKSKIGVSTDWYIAVKYWGLSSIRSYLHQLSD